MTSKKLFLILCSVIGLLFIALIAGTYGINKLLGTQADKLVAQKAKSQALNQQQVGFIAAKKDIAKYSDLEKITRAVVPEDKNQAEAIREIVKIAANNNISLGSISFPASTLGNTPTGKPIGSAAPAATAPVSGATKPAKTLSQLEPVKNIPGVYLLQIVVASDSSRPVGYYSFINFLNDLEHNRRTAQVSAITLQPEVTNSSLLTFTLTLNEYIKP
jgi:hypothetical protein